MIKNLRLRRRGTLLSLSDLVNRRRRRVSADIRSRCQTSYLGDYGALCRVLGRYIMYVDTRDVGFASHIMINGFWEMWLTEYIIRTVKPGWRVLDIGANYGYYSFLLADIVGVEGHCTAFEPNPVAARALRQSLSVNGFDNRSQVIEAALSSVSGKNSLLLVPTGEPKNCRLTEEIDENIISRGEGNFIEVPLVALDELAMGRIDFIKIDAEGAEDKIIQGMTRLISQHRPHMVVEYNFGRLQDPVGFLDSLMSAYGVLRHLEESGKVVEVSIKELVECRIDRDWLLVLR